MSVHPPSQLTLADALVSLRGVTMGDVLDRLAGLSDLDNSRRAGLTSAVRTFCRGLGKAPIDLSGRAAGRPREFGAVDTRRLGSQSAVVQ